MRGAELRQLRTDLQMVFQDPHAALNPSMTHRGGVGHPLVIHGSPRGRSCAGAWWTPLERVGLSPVERFLTKYPSDLSGGQKQRAVIARAIILNPEVLVADEPVSMLDMSVRAKILQLMLDLKQDLGLTYVYITHDLAIGEVLLRPHRDHVPRPGRGDRPDRGDLRQPAAPVHQGAAQGDPRARPRPDGRRATCRAARSPTRPSPPLGCAFHPRCPEAIAECGWESRDLRALMEEHWTRKVEAYDARRPSSAISRCLDQPSTTATIGKGGAGEVRALLDRIKAENPDEPLWTGVRGIEPAGNGVDVQFQPADSPTLRRAGGVDVACVLYPEE